MEDFKTISVHTDASFSRTSLANPSHFITFSDCVLISLAAQAYVFSFWTSFCSNLELLFSWPSISVSKSNYVSIGGLTKGLSNL